ncbi:glycosyltransferase family 2 protein [Candidatus Calescamantes bacterium]|nr:glycosyltransferase family 2 protein [Candidatus Calescamantes bacterium]
MKKVCVVIPAYNEENKIGEVVERINKTGEVEEIIVVDDGSKDSTSLEAEKKGATVLKHPKNLGKGRALLTGFKYAIEKGYESIITMDGDGQHLPEEIPSFLKVADKADIIVGSRMQKPEGMPPIRLFTNLLTSLLTSLLAGKKIKDSQSGFRLIKTHVLKNLSLTATKFDIESEILIKAGKKGYRIMEIPITTVYFPDSIKRSKISPLRDTLRFIYLIWRNL